MGRHQYDAAERIISSIEHRPRPRVSYGVRPSAARPAAPPRCSCSPDKNRLTVFTVSLFSL